VRTRNSRGQAGSRFASLIKLIFLFLLTGFASLVLAAFLLYRFIAPQLPDTEVLRDARYQTPMSLYSKDGLLMAQYGEMKRSPVTFSEVPSKVIQAFLAAEDNRFFKHRGVDYVGLMRATFSFLRTGKKKQGGSTITMQVARNFFLSSEKTFYRKLKEIVLAVKIESELTKEQILELYLNKIYFGHHAYGVIAASQVYYGKKINELEVDEIAMIAGLPKAPSSFNPITNPQRALDRRNYVLKRMRKLGYIDDQTYQEAVKRPVTAKLHTTPIALSAPYVAELIRNEMYRQYGEAAYTNGYRIYTTIDSRLQEAADRAMRLALHEYDERHGFRGVKQRIDLKKEKRPEHWDKRLSSIPKAGETVPGLVLAVNETSADVYLGDEQHIVLDWEGLKWARRYISENAQGPFPRSAKEILKAGDLIRLRKDSDGHWKLSQIPEVEGALVALDPTSGAVVALAGGYDFAISKFNRATQAQRQPGSGFKPILYSAALTQGYTPASVVNDAPVVFSDPSQESGFWRPQNYSGRFYGPTRLRVALAKSRNLVSIRLLQTIGLKKAIDMAQRFGFQPEELPRSLPLALGSGTATPLRMAQAYAVFANGGFRIEPYFIERIETEASSIVFRATPQIACANCSDADSHRTNFAPRTLSAQVHYMMNSMLQDVVRTGTAVRATELGRNDVAGKTGTTNEYKDAWFNGYVPSLTAVAWLGFDASKSLGKGETGGKAALPMWIQFMREALKDVPEQTFPLPSGLTIARMDPSTGMLALPGSTNAVFEVFPSGRVPRYYAAPRVSAPPPSEPTESEGQPVPLQPTSPSITTEKPIESLF
jgi:penicillin-binding protein 1A